MPLGDVVARTEREHLIEVPRETNWNKSRAAIQLKISRNILRYRIDKYGLRPSP